MKRQGIRIIRIMLLGWFFVAASVQAETVKIEKVDFASLPGDRFQVLMEFSDTPPEPSGYSIDNPSRIVLDFPGVESLLEQKKYALAFENARSAVILSTEERTRLILNLEKMASYQTEIDGNTLVLNVGSKQSATFVQKGAVAMSASDSTTGSKVANIDFTRGEDGEGVVSVDLTSSGENIDISQVGNNLQLNFYNTELPQDLDRRLDVGDFATPVKTIDSTSEGSTTSVMIEVGGYYDYLAYQADNQYVVSIKPLTKQEKELQIQEAFAGEKLSLNFQDIGVRSVLQIIADFTELNLVASDTVRGNITLRLENVPWDQALDIVLKSKGLDKRTNGNVIMVAPAAEIAETERLQVEANKQIEELAPLFTEFIRIRYADARELFELFDSNGNDGDGSRGSSRGGSNDDRTSTASILSSRGTAIVDERTNTIILTDTAEKINGFRELVEQIDIPVEQVLIESRIVIASTDFKKELGVRWGAAARGSINGNPIAGFGGISNSTDDDSDGGGITPGDGELSLGDLLAVDLGSADPSGSFSMAYLSDNIFLDMELSALEDSGRGEIVSQPKVVTGDKQEASIETGTEVPFLEASASGAASLEFKEAVLKLEVTPQITPDKTIIMDLFISQDSIGEIVPGIFGSLVPTIDVTRLNTQVLVADGQTIVLGGIFQVEQFNREDKVPVLGDIPYLGRLFKHTLNDIKKREILIFITPKIINESINNIQ